MKKTFLLLFIIFIIALLGSCSVMNSDMSEQSLSIDEQITADNGLPVELFYVKSHADYNGMAGDGWMTGYIEIENLSYDKEVVVHWREIHSSTWNDTAAGYVKTVADGKEVWYFETSKVEFSARLSADFQFAIKYVVNGQEYWDNNSSNDYKISVGSRPRYTTGMILGKSFVALQDCSVTPGFFSTPAYLNGTVILKNLAYDKVVKIAYTTDNWNTASEGFATYMRPHDGDCEKWSIRIDLGGGYGYYPTVKFAILYQVNGNDIWDNNFGDNYSSSN